MVLGVSVIVTEYLEYNFKRFSVQVDLVLQVFNLQFNLFYPPFLKQFLIEKDFFFSITAPYSLVVHHIPNHHSKNFTRHHVS